MTYSRCGRGSRLGWPVLLLALTIISLANFTSVRAQDGGTVFEDILNDGLQAKAFVLVKDPQTGKVLIDEKLGTPHVELVDSEGLDRVLVKLRPKLTPAARNFCVGICKLCDPRDRPTWVHVLRRIGAATNDPVALQLAAHAEDDKGLPQPTARGLELIRLLTAELIAKGAAELRPEGTPPRSALVLVDQAKFDAVLKDKQAWLTPDLVDTAIALNRTIPHGDLLRGIAQLRKDERPLAYAELQAGSNQTSPQDQAASIRLLRDSAERFSKLQIPRAEAEARIRLGIRYEQADRNSEALAEFQLARPLCRRSYGTAHRRWPEILFRISRQYRLRKEYQRALYYLVQGMPPLEAMFDKEMELAAECFAEFGQLDVALGHVEEGIENLDHARMVFAELRGATDPSVVDCRLAIVDANIGAGQLAKAESELQFVLTELEKPALASRRWEGLLQLGKLQAAQQQTAKARATLEKALAAAHGTPANVRAGICRELAKIAEQQGDFSTALAANERALVQLSFSAELPQPAQEQLAAAEPAIVELLAEKSRVLRKQSQASQSGSTIEGLKASQAAAELALGLLDRAGRQSAGSEDQMGTADRLSELFLIAVENSLQLHRLEMNEQYLPAAFAAAERGRAQLLAAALGEPTQFPSPEIARLYRAKLERLAELRTQDRRFGAQMILPIGQRDPQKLLAVQEAWREARLAFDDAQSAFVQAAPELRDSGNVSVCTPEQARACLRPGEVGLIYVLGKQTGHVLVLSPKASRGPGVQAVELGPVAPIQELAAALIDNNTLDRNRLAQSRGTAAFERLLGPVKQLIAGQNLCLVLTGTGLERVPFEVLYEPPGADTPGGFLGATRQIRYAPSFTSLHALRARNRGVAPGRNLLAVGNPLYQSKDRAATTPPVEFAPPPLPNLPGTRQEIESIAGVFPAAQVTAWLGPQATETAVRTASREGKLASYRYLHFAVHGLNEYGMGRQPGVVFSLHGDPANDGVLEPEEVLTLQLNSELVVLSACSSGVGAISKTEGSLSVARSFLLAGSSAIVCSLWKVEDQATAHFMTTFYRQLTAGKPPRAALQLTKQTLIEEGYAPSAWGAFVLIGE